MIESNFTELGRLRAAEIAAERRYEEATRLHDQTVIQRALNEWQRTASVLIERVADYAHSPHRAG